MKRTESMSTEIRGNRDVARAKVEIGGAENALADPFSKIGITIERPKGEIG